MKKSLIDFYTRLARGIAAQFGPDCEVVVHDLQGNDIEHSIVAIENGHVSGRKMGDGPSHIVLEALKNGPQEEDKLAYLTKTRDGKVLKSSTIFIRDDSGEIIGILGINFDITILLSLEDHLKVFTNANTSKKEEETISINIGDLLDELIQKSVRNVGKPVTLMNREDKVKVIRQLNDSGAFLITKSGPRVCEYLGISKYTLYSYLDEVKSSDNTQGKKA